MVRTKHRPMRVGTSNKVPRKQLANKLHRKTIATAASDLKKKKRRFRPGVRALMEIRAFQKSTNLLIRRAPFQRLVRELAQNIYADIRFQATAIEGKLLLRPHTDATAVQHDC